MNNKALRRTALCIAMGICLSSVLSLQSAYAANNDGSVAGHAAPGAVITVQNAETGFTRTVNADENGNYRFPFLPIGTYELRATGDGMEARTIPGVRVSLGNTTNINVTTDAVTLGTVQVLGTGIITPVDVRSTESATNITREEYSRLPVEQDVGSVALLAPGLNKGDSAFGGVSFGGSSVSENTFYVNGLNVTDFYNRVGFSSAPFAFYKEFQVKTGGYSVEFGRTTGGVINAVTRSGTNEFEFGAELTWEPSWLQTTATNRYDADGNLVYAASRDEYDRAKLNAFASGPLIKDRLFFFAMYEARDYEPTNTSSEGDTLFKASSDDGFWGGKLDWQITDNHLLEFTAFSDEDQSKEDQFVVEDGNDNYTNTVFSKTGGTNWALAYTGYLTDAFSMKALYGKTERNRATSSLNDINCNRVVDNRPPPLRGDQGCTRSALIEEAVDDREAARLDFEWTLGDHLLRFGLDHETNTSEYQRHYPGPGGFRYDVNATTPGATLANGGVVPPGATAYVRARRLEVDGTFETINSAWYIEDTWSVTPNLILNGGLRMEAFDNKNAEGESYIKIDDMLAPRFGFSWDVNGDQRTKLFGNLGRYFLPVANVINIKQAGGFLDERTFYVFQGYETRENNGVEYQVPILGPQIGPIDNSQGDGTVGDLRGEVDADMDPVYQDELILGFQSMIDEKWSWGARAIYRKMHNAIDDMEITSNGILCDGEPGNVGFVMGNPGETLTVYTDTDCDGENDAFVDIDTSKAGWALYDDEGNYIGERGWKKPERDYKALELTIDRAWDDKWALNASYTLAYSRGNYEGPVNSDNNFSDAGRTEAFDDPWVNYRGYGPLPNDRRHSFKARGTYALSEHWQIGATTTIQTGRPITGFGVGNPFDGTNYHSFYICVANCDSENPSERVYQYSPRGGYGTTPWTIDVGASLTYLRKIGGADLAVKLALYNLFNQEEVLEVDEDRQLDIDNQLNSTFLQGTNYQKPRYGQLTISVTF